MIAVNIFKKQQDEFMSEGLTEIQAVKKVFAENGNYNFIITPYIIIIIKNLTVVVVVYYYDFFLRLLLYLS